MYCVTTKKMTLQKPIMVVYCLAACIFIICGSQAEEVAGWEI